MMQIDLVSTTQCELGEGAFWHPERGTFFWFDILGARLFETDGKLQRGWQFDRPVSAAGWVSEHELLIATATDLTRFDLRTGVGTSVVPLESDLTENRSNDGRADPQGGFWIGTMRYDPSQGEGAIYRYYQGELREIFGGVTVPNAICFAPDGQTAFYGDSDKSIVYRVALDGDGWPLGPGDVWLDLSAQGLVPDGAVIDAAGRFWNAQWGAGRVACYDMDGTLLQTLDLPTQKTTCPAFGGADLSTLYVTSAAIGQSDPAAGQTFSIPLKGRGQAEHRVLL